MFERYVEHLRRRDGKLSAMILREVVCRRPLLCEIADELRTLALPALIITGDEDRDCLPTSLFLKQTLPRAGLAVFPQTGHAVNLEEPERFGDALQAFYDSIDAGTWQ
jgi:pimeloyl-ACP methyl ester carboxylesterase